MTYRQILDRALECFGDPARRPSYFDLYSNEIVLHGYAGVEPGLTGVKQFYEGIWAAVPDARVEVEETIESGDRLVVRFTMTGTHRGTLLGVPATGRPIRLPGITILRFAGERCVERWSVADFLSVLGQIGAFGAAG